MWNFQVADTLFCSKLGLQQSVLKNGIKKKGSSTDSSWSSYRPSSRLIFGWVCPLFDMPPPTMNLGRNFGGWFGVFCPKFLGSHETPEMLTHPKKWFLVAERQPFCGLSFCRKWLIILWFVIRGSDPSISRHGCPAIWLIWNKKWGGLHLYLEIKESTSQQRWEPNGFSF